MKELTKAEEQVMQVLWEIEEGFVKDVLEQLPEPKPAYNTISTIIRILVKKEVVGYTAYGKSHQYHPLISREAYSDFKMNHMVTNYFGGSFKNLVSFFVERNDLDVSELDDVVKLIESQKDQPND